MIGINVECATLLCPVMGLLLSRGPSVWLMLVSSGEEQSSGSRVWVGNQSHFTGHVAAATVSMEKKITLKKKQCLASFSWELTQKLLDWWFRGNLHATLGSSIFETHCGPQTIWASEHHKVSWKSSSVQCDLMRGSLSAWSHCVPLVHRGLLPWHSFYLLFGKKTLNISPVYNLCLGNNLCC